MIPFKDIKIDHNPNSGAEKKRAIRPARISPTPRRIVVDAVKEIDPIKIF
jgi:hypothetical protein